MVDEEILRGGDEARVARREHMVGDGVGGRLRVRDSRPQLELHLC